MTWLAPQLRRRVQIKKPTQTPNSVTGGLDRGYETLLTIWAAFAPVKFGSFAQATYIRGAQTSSVITHEFVIRRVAIQNLGKSFGSGFGSGFDSIADLAPLKSDYFLFVEEESTTKGRLFRIHKIQDVGERKEYLKLFCEEIEEQAAGYQP